MNWQLVVTGMLFGLASGLTPGPLTTLESMARKSPVATVMPRFSVSTKLMPSRSEYNEKISRARCFCVSVILLRMMLP